MGHCLCRSRGHLTNLTLSARITHSLEILSPECDTPYDTPRIQERGNFQTTCKSAEKCQICQFFWLPGRRVGAMSLGFLGIEHCGVIVSPADGPSVYYSVASFGHQTLLGRGLHCVLATNAAREALPRI